MATTYIQSTAPIDIVANAGTTINLADYLALNFSGGITLPSSFDRVVLQLLETLLRYVPQQAVHPHIGLGKEEASAGNVGRFDVGNLSSLLWR